MAGFERRTREGCIFAVKVGGDAGGSTRQILAKALAEGLRDVGFKLSKMPRSTHCPGCGEEREAVISAEELHRVAAFLIDDLGMTYSAQALDGKGGRYNEIVRGAARDGIPMLDHVGRMLRDAWRMHDKSPEGGANQRIARGKVRGIAQVLAYIRSPYSWDAYSTADRNSLVKETENDARAEIKAGKS